MMKKTIFIIALVLSCQVNAQNNWLKSFGGLNADEVLDATTDQNGNIIMTGYMTGTTTFGSSVLQSNGNSDVLVIKTNPTGSILWAINAGGTLADRANSVTTDNAGNIYITGFYYNAASFGNDNLTGQDREVFISKIDPTGNFIWTKSMGGEFGDTGYGVEVDNNGNVFCTGQYKGSGIFGSQIFNSTINPDNGLPSYDIFLTKLDGTGNFLWTKDGKAKYDDRGLSITVDDAGNCYLAAEFSDTISFQNTYNNSALNAGLILQFDSNGNEHWVTIAFAGQVLINDIKWKQNYLYLGGDFRGNLTITDINSIDTYNSQNNYNTFVMKMTDLGDLEWLSSNYSDNELYTKQLTLDTNNDIYLAGLFKCTYTEMNQVYGNSTFLSVGYRDVHYMKYTNNGQFQWSRQIGSQKDDYCASIIVNTPGYPILAGSFENYMNIPSSANFAYESQQVTYTYSQNCPNGLFGEYATQVSAGYKDIFLTNPYNSNRLPYDYYEHTNNYCLTDTIPPCIGGTCLDSIEFCYSPFGYIIGVDHFQIESRLRPLYNYEWNNGANNIDTLFGQTSNTSQTFYVHIERQDGCFEWIDTTVVTINPLPNAPLITDSWGYNSNQPPLTTNIDTCFTDTLFVLASVNNNDTLIWGDNYSLLNDSILFTTNSLYIEALAINNYGCESNNELEVIMDDFALHDTLDPFIHFQDSILQATDSITVCNQFSFQSFILDSAFINPNGSTPYKYTVWTLNGNYMDSVYHHYLNKPFGLTDPYMISDSGWYHIEAHLVNQCGDTVDYYIERDFYVSIVPLPQIFVTGNTFACLGDTVTLYANHYQDSVLNWGGPNIIQTFNDSASIIAIGLQSNYQVQVDTFAMGITCINSDWITISTPPQPEITIFPSNGIVCPADSVLLTALDGVNWQWIGPTGDFMGTNQTQYVNLPGFYHCIVTLASGCILTSNFVEAKEYSSPFLVVEPGVICSGDSAKIEIISPLGTTINWLNPLSGSSLIQYVDSAGIYYCETSFCNITQIDSVIVIESNPEVSLNVSGDTLICPVNEIFIAATGGFLSYNWNTGQNFTAFTTSDSGFYFVDVEDIYGCQATSDTLVINYLSNPLPPIASDTSICYGDDVLLTVSANDNIIWYTNSTEVNTGSSYQLYNVQTPILFSITNSDSLCISEATTINVTIHQSSIQPILIGDSILCEQDFFQILTDTLPNSIDYNWTTPNGTTNSSNISIDPIAMSDSGIYSLFFSDSFCTSDTTYFNLIVNPLPSAELTFTSDTIICPLDTIQLGVISNATTYLWNNQSTDSLQTITESGVYFYYATENGCYAYSDTINVIVAPLTDANFDLNEIICSGDSITFSIDSIYTVVWLNNQDTISTSNIFNTGILSDSTNYSVQLNQNGLCPITIESIVSILPNNYLPNLTYTDTVCVSDTIHFLTDNFIYDTYNWYLNDSLISTTYFTDLITTSNSTIDVNLVVSVNGCQSDTANVNLIIHNYPTLDIPSDTTLCFNQSLVLNSDYQIDYNWTINPNYYDSLVYLTITNSFGCITYDSLNVNYQDCYLSSPNVFTPNGDLINDIFYFTIPNGEITNISIANRWGEIIYQSNLGEWNGLKNDLKKAVSGTYFYIVDYKTVNGTILQQQGYLTLFR